MSNSVLKDYDEGARERELLLFQSKIQNIIGIILLISLIPSECDSKHIYCPK
jgi:hypothetical protein